MKPIIITIKDNSVVMSVAEFKKHIEDAYYQGYRDASSITTSSSNRWWEDLSTNTIMGTLLNADTSRATSTTERKA